MTDPRPILTLAHSPDPDDAFMWWPITGKVDPAGAALAGDGGPVLDTGRFRYRALPADIEVLNRRAVEKGDIDITALSVRCYADVKDRYAVTSAGASFGDGFGPKVVVRNGDRRIGGIENLKDASITVAVPGTRTTAFLLLGMVLGPEAMRARHRFLEMPFDQVIGAVASGRADAGLVIHEGQLTFEDAGLALVLDVGAWWKERTGLKVPLGVNTVRRDLDSLYWPGTLREVGATLKRSVAWAMERRSESVEYTMAFARANVERGGGLPPTVERVDRYCRMYVTEETLDMGAAGRGAIALLLGEGSRAGLCPDPGIIDLV